MLVQRTHTIRLRYLDNDGTDATCECNLHPSLNLDAALLFAGQFRAMVSALSDAVCIESDVIIRMVETHTKAPPTADTSRQAVFVFDAGADNFAAIHVPSIRADLLLTAGPFAGIAIDRDAPEVAAFVTVLDGACDPFGADLVDLANAYRQQL